MSRLAGVLYFVVAASAVALVGILILLRRQERHAPAIEQAPEISIDGLRSSLDAALTDLSVFSSEVDSWSMQVDPSDVEAERELSVVRDHLRTAVKLSHEAATAGDIATLTSHLEAGRRSMSRSEILLAEAPHQDQPPCFFNPNHGPAWSTASWTTTSGKHIRVPCCAADLERLRWGALPYSRTFPSGGTRQPWWTVGSDAAAWAQGWFAVWADHPSMSNIAQAAPVLAELDAVAAEIRAA